jgi:hypothetical protein
MLLIHLHNMLVKKAYLKKPDSLFQSLERLFAQGFFIGGKVPSSKFSDALQARLQALVSVARKKHPPPPNFPTDQDYDLHRVLAVEDNPFFKTPSGLLLYRQAKWTVAAIPDADVPLDSPLFMLRIAETKQTMDPTTHQIRFDDTPIVKRARADGMTDEAIRDLDLASSPKLNINRSPDLREGSWTSRLGREQLLELAKTDLRMDISSQLRPLSSFNYVADTCIMMSIFAKIETELAERRNKLYVSVYETDVRLARSKRIALVLLAMTDGG